MSCLNPIALGVVSALALSALPVMASPARPHARVRRATPRKTPARRVRARPKTYRDVVGASRHVTGSVSLGDTSHGRLLRAAALPPRGPHHALLPGYLARGTRYGTTELITLLRYAARQVARRHKGARLMVGNLSTRRGGDLKWSVSHNCGRDGDLAFYVRRRRRPVTAPSLVKFRSNLRSSHPRGYRFDVPRNWRLIRALLTHPTIRVQWIFIANHLRRTLLAHARKHGASAAILARADRTLKQPTDSLSHADHFHVRIYCSRQDRLEGCRDRAPYWLGVPTHNRAVAARIRLLLPGLRDDDAALRGRVLDALDRLDARAKAVPIARLLLSEPDPRNRHHVFRLLKRWRAREPGVFATLHRFIPKGGPETRLAYRLLGGFGSRQATASLRRGLRSVRRIPSLRRGGASIPEAWLAARAARSVRDLRLVPALISALAHRQGRVRHEAARTLRRLTNHSFRYAWRGRRSARQQARRVARWRRWWTRHQRLGRPALLVRGFKRLRRRGFDLRRPRTLRWLVALTLRPDHLGYNADRLLGRVIGRKRSHEKRSVLARHRAWSAWYRKRYRRRRRRRPRRRIARRSRPRRRRLALARRRRRRPTPRPTRRIRRHPVRAPR